MPRQRKGAAPQNIDQVVQEQIDALWAAIRPLQAAQATTVQTIDVLRHLNSVQGEIAVHVPTDPALGPDAPSAFAYRHKGVWYLLGQKFAKYEIKVFDDTEFCFVGDSAFKFAIDADLDGYTIVAVSAYVTTSGTGAHLIQLRNFSTSQDILSTRIRIDSTEKHSIDGSPQPVINPAQAIVSAKHEIHIDVDSIGTGSKGLGVGILLQEIAA